VDDVAADNCDVSGGGLTVRMAHDWRDRWIVTSLQFASWEDEVPVEALLRFLGKPAIELLRGPLSDAQITQALTAVTQVIDEFCGDEARLSDALQAFYTDCEEYTRSVSIHNSSN